MDSMPIGVGTGTVSSQMAPYIPLTTLVLHVRHNPPRLRSGYPPSSSAKKQPNGILRSPRKFPNLSLEGAPSQQGGPLTGTLPLNTLVPPLLGSFANMPLLRH